MDSETLKHYYTNYMFDQLNTPNVCESYRLSEEEIGIVEEIGIAEGKGKG
jgi:hypothetical protein